MPAVCPFLAGRRAGIASFLFLVFFIRTFPQTTQRKEILMKSKLFTSVLVIAWALAVAIPTPLRASTTLSYSIFFPATHSQVKMAEAWAQEIETQSKGAVKINIFAGGSLTPAQQCFDGVARGISDLGMSAFAYTKGRFPVMEALDLPLGYKSGLAATRIANAFFKQQNPAELADVKVLYLHAHGPGLLHTNKPVRTLADLRQMKIRATGSSANIVRALGALAVAMPQGETYEALKRGVVDGTLGPIEVLKGWRQGEVIKSTTDCAAVGYTTVFFVVMNKGKWNALSPSVQKIFEEVSAKFINEHGKAWDADDVVGRQYTLSLNNNIITLSEQEKTAWVNAVQSLFDDYIDYAQSKGLNGKGITRNLRAIVGNLNK